MKGETYSFRQPLFFFSRRRTSPSPCDTYNLLYVSIGKRKQKKIILPPPSHPNSCHLLNTTWPRVYLLACLYFPTSENSPARQFSEGASGLTCGATKESCYHMHTLPLILHSHAASSQRRSTPNDNDIIVNVPGSPPCLGATTNLARKLFPRVAQLTRTRG